MSDVNTDTAVILEALNNKVDLDGNNLSVQGKSLISGLGMPSGRYISLTLGATGTHYIAPANGYFSFDCGFTNAFNSWASLGYIDGSFRDAQNGTTAGTSSHTLFLPVSKGTECYLTYGNLNSSYSHKLRFYYAEGESNV